MPARLSKTGPQVLQPLILDPVPIVPLRDTIARVEGITIKYHLLEASISATPTTREGPRRIEGEHSVLSMASSGERYILRFPLEGRADYEYGLTFSQLRGDLDMTPVEESARFTVLDRAVISVGGSRVISPIKERIEILDRAIDEGRLREDLITKRIIEKLDDLISHATQFYIEEEKVGIQYRRTQKLFPNTRLFDVRELSRKVLIDYDLFERAHEEFKRIRGVIKEPTVLAPTPEAEIDNIYGYLGNPFAYSELLRGLTLGWRFPATPVVTPTVRLTLDGIRKLNVKLYAVHVGRGRRVVCALP